MITLEGCRAALKIEERIKSIDDLLFHAKGGFMPINGAAGQDVTWIGEELMEGLVAVLKKQRHQLINDLAKLGVHFDK